MRQRSAFADLRSLAIQVTSHTLPDGGVLDVSGFDYRTSDGVRLRKDAALAHKMSQRSNARIFMPGRDGTLELARVILNTTSR